MIQEIQVSDKKNNLYNNDNEQEEFVKKSIELLNNDEYIEKIISILQNHNERQQQQLLKKKKSFIEHVSTIKERAYWTKNRIFKWIINGAVVVILCGIIIYKIITFIHEKDIPFISTTYQQEERISWPNIIVKVTSCPGTDLNILGCRYCGIQDCVTTNNTLKITDQENDIFLSINRNTSQCEAEDTRVGNQFMIVVMQDADFVTRQSQCPSLGFTIILREKEIENLYNASLSSINGLLTVPLGTLNQIEMEKHTLEFLNGTILTSYPYTFSYSHMNNIPEFMKDKTTSLMFRYRTFIVTHQKQVRIDNWFNLIGALSGMTSILFLSRKIFINLNDQL